MWTIILKDKEVQLNKFTNEVIYYNNDWTTYKESLREFKIWFGWTSWLKDITKDFNRELKEKNKAYKKDKKIKVWEIWYDRFGQDYEITSEWFFWYSVEYTTWWAYFHTFTDTMSWCDLLYTYLPYTEITEEEVFNLLIK